MGQPSAAEPGELIAQKYRVVCPLGQGGMGAVVLAVHEPLGAKVAIKILTCDNRSRADDKRFLLEAQAAAQLKSDHVAHVTDFGTLADGRHFMAMEYLEGEDLSSRIRRRGPLPLEEAVDFTIQACAGLAEAHASGIIHRDIKPSNLFVTRRSDGAKWIKVLDFGVSKFQLGDAGMVQSLTSTGLAVGTPLYMSPEQVNNTKSLDGRSDVWSLGVVLYEMLRGQSPFFDESLGVTLLNVLEKPHVPLLDAGVDIPPPFDELVNACLSKDPTKRPKSVVDLAEHLRPFASEDGSRLAVRVRAIAKRTAARVQVSLPPPALGPAAGPTLRVSPTTAPVFDSGEGPSPASTPAPDAHTISPEFHRSRSGPVLAGLIALGIVIGLVAWFIATRPGSPGALAGTSVEPGPTTTTAPAPQIALEPRSTASTEASTEASAEPKGSSSARVTPSPAVTSATKAGAQKVTATPNSTASAPEPAPSPRRTLQ